ncbi:putative toxin-antitoxin system toxin component, PIN family [Almyronema epifaneia]|uniref:Toxin-antitoxin system toxin component, PIN family n=1 Tax=Almyronema epifaneia S1 TaxID=2991925 RepID=A0ABW6ILF2_9CYAN
MMAKLRCVLDTNVWVSALLLKNSLPFRVVERTLAAGIVLRSAATALELMQVLSRKKFDKYVTAAERQIFLSKFLLESELVEIQEAIAVCRDPKDNKFLELGVNGRADFIVTGDEDLLCLHPFRNIQIVIPQAFLLLTDGEGSP